MNPKHRKNTRHLKKEIVIPLVMDYKMKKKTNYTELLHYD